MNASTTTTNPAPDTEQGADGLTERPSSAISRSIGWVATHALLVILIIFVVIFAVLSPVFGSLSNGEVILLTASAPGLLAIGQTFVILTGGIDLSVGSVVGLSGVVAAMAAQGSAGNPAVAVGAGVAAGAAVGAVNGLLVRAKVPPFIATLGTMTAATGLAQVLSHGSPVSNLSSGFLNLGQVSVLGIALPVLVTTLVFVVLWFLAARTRYGMHVYSVGGNPLAARIAGVKINRVTFSVYLLSGLLAGLAGTILASRVTAGIATTGAGYELNAIAAAVIGGVSLAGGRGTLPGTVVGVLIITTLGNGLDILNVNPFYQQIVTGVLIVAAVLTNVLSARRQEVG